MQAAAAHGVRHGPINLGFYPTAHLGPEHQHHTRNQSKSITEYLNAHRSNLPTGRRQLVPVPNGFSCAGSNVRNIGGGPDDFTKVVPFHLVFDTRRRTSTTLQMVRFVSSVQHVQLEFPGQLYGAMLCNVLVLLSFYDSPSICIIKRVLVL